MYTLYATNKCSLCNFRYQDISHLGPLPLLLATSHPYIALVDQAICASMPVTCATWSLLCLYSINPMQPEFFLTKLNDFNSMRVNQPFLCNIHAIWYHWKGESSVYKILKVIILCGSHDHHHGNLSFKFSNEIFYSKTLYCLGHS